MEFPPRKQAVQLCPEISQFPQKKMSLTGIETPASLIAHSKKNVVPVSLKVKAMSEMPFL